MNSIKSEESKASRSKQLSKIKKEAPHSADDYQFKCGCGKTYKSYKALYNHGQTIHGGILPGGSSDVSKIKAHNSGDGCVLVHLFDKYAEFNSDYVKFLATIPGSQEIFESDQNMATKFSASVFGREHESQLLRQVVDQLRSEFEVSFGAKYFDKLEYIIHEIANKEDFNCIEAFSLFVLYISRFSSPDFLKEILFLLVHYIKMLNKKGWKRFQELVSDFRMPRDLTFCESQSAELVPDFANIFTLNYFPKIVKRHQNSPDTDKLVFFGNDPIYFLRSVIMTQHLSKWVHISGFSSADIEMIKY